MGLNDNLIATIVILGLAILLIIGGTILQNIPRMNPYIITGGRGKKVKFNIK
jgi:hypothetical protein